MASLKGKTFVITGATGRQGSAVVRHLLKEGACVKALTRDPNSKRAQQLTALAAKLVTGDMCNPVALTTLFQGAAGIYSVQISRGAWKEGCPFSNACIYVPHVHWR